ncbi:amidase [Brevundimonas sp.]|uniref:amidase n=1 Tax=Brevundimonas sp. TaxID=1871086 RepID=UPI002D42B996|nr:amidase [Brevundimonas sp.]HYD27727.1 amidase [Brevundimonas sp.]
MGKMIIAATAAALLLAGAASAQEVYGARHVTPQEASTNSVLVWTDPQQVVRWEEGSGIAGMPILLKDNIETEDMPTTAGSMALIDNAPGRDAPLVARLREAGAVILGKTNLSEWANIRSSNSTSGWSAVGGLTRNPHALDRNACGSSSGSGAAVAAGIAPAAIGTETDGSITCPAAINGIVGFKPTVGLVSRTHIVPISHSQDTAGPMTRTVEDAAIVLSVIAGSDPLDPATAEADARKVDYRSALDARSLNGARIGVMRFAGGYTAETLAVFEQNLQVLRDAGAVLVDLTEAPDEDVMGSAELTVLLYELKHDLNAYLASTRPDQVRTRTLADVIAFNAAEPRELALFGQELFLQAQAKGGLDEAEYIEARATSLRLAGAEGIDKLMGEHDLDALVGPTTGPAWTTDVVNGDHYGGAVSTMPAIAGYPHLTVPMGFVKGLPVGMSFIAGKWDDARVLSLGYAFEQLTHAIRPPAFAPTVDGAETVAPLLAPLR